MTMSIGRRWDVGLPVGEGFRLFVWLGIVERMTGSAQIQASIMEFFLC